MPQQRIDEILVTPKKKAKGEEIMVEAAVARASPVKIDEEIARAETAAAVGQEFVKNGCRDRYGNLRSNQGGRPKKVVQQILKQKSNRKAPGVRTRDERGAIEKLKMIAEMEQICKKVREAHAGRTDNYLEILEMRAVKKAFPQFQKTFKIEQCMAQKGLWQQIAVDNKLGQNLSSPWKVKRGVQNSSYKRHGNHKAAGFRKPGGGRKNKFLKIWQRVKVSHIVDRLRGVEVDEQDIFLKFQDEAQLEIEILQILNEKKVLDYPQIAWLEELQERIQKLKESKVYRQTYVDRLMAWGEMSVGRPQRRSSMSLEQDKHKHKHNSISTKKHKNSIRTA